MGRVIVCDFYERFLWTVGKVDINFILFLDLSMNFPLSVLNYAKNNYTQKILIEKN